MSGPSSQSSPSHRRSRKIVVSDSAVDRSTSVSSMRRMKADPDPRARNQLKSAVRTLPTWSCPVGLGAKRSRIAESDMTDERDRVRGDGFAAAEFADALVGLALDAHGRGANPDRVRQ